MMEFWDVKIIANQSSYHDAYDKGNSTALFLTPTASSAAAIAMIVHLTWDHQLIIMLSDSIPFVALS